MEKSGLETNPRYVAYAKAHGKTPDEMLEYDTELYPGGCMCGYICWMSKRKADFRKANPKAFNGFDILDQNAWTQFLRDAANKGTKE